MKQFLSTHLDSFGIFTSLLCAVHCSILPIILALGVFSGLSWMESHATEAIFLGLSVVFILTSLGSSYRNKHHNLLPLKMATVGLILFSLALILPHHLHIFTSTVGGLCIALSHYINMRLVKAASSKIAVL